MTRPAHRLPIVLGWMLVLLGGLRAPAAEAQAPLFLVNEGTTLRDVDFRFAGSESFEEDLLQAQIVLSGPGFFDKLQDALDFLPFVSYTEPPFEPVELQKDVVRLRRFYQRNGFLHPSIDYPTSQLDTTRNSIRVIFTIDEGPPLIIQDVGFFTPDGRYALYTFEGGLRDDWVRFRDRIGFRIGERYTVPRQIQIRDEVLTWLQNRGYAFATVDVEATVDSTANVADIRFAVDPGPRGRITEIVVEGNESVSDEVLKRELPFEEGDRFSQRAVVQGQRELFSLNLFRLALADVPPACDAVAPTPGDSTVVDAIGCQPRDETVEVHYRVREGKPRYVTAQTGFARDDGVVLEGTWRHRNFLGGARLLSVTAAARTGVGGRVVNEQAGTNRSLNVSALLRQPYLFTTRLSGITSPFLAYSNDAELLSRSRSWGINNTLVYEFLPFRTLSLQQTLSRTTPLQSEALQLQTPEGDVLEVEGAFTKHTLGLSGTFGRTNDFLNPRRGWLVRPLAQLGGRGIGGDVEFVKGAVEAVAYVPVTRRVSLSARLYGGVLRPLGGSTNQLTDALTEFQFDPIRFYAGGPNDVRGWTTSMLGPKSLLIDSTFVRREGVPDDEPADSLTRIAYEYEPVGGRSKLAGNIELRLPFPGLGPQWHTAVFLDAGQVFLQEAEPRGRTALVFPLDERNTGRLNATATKYGAGAGFRYETLVGFIRVDFAYKLNPDQTDLYGAGALYRHEVFGERLPELTPWGTFRRRFTLHLSIGQAF